MYVWANTSLLIIIKNKTNQAGPLNDTASTSIAAGNNSPHYYIDNILTIFKQTK